MAADANATRRQRAWDSIRDGASRTWSRTSGGSAYVLTLANPQIRTLHGGLVFSVDMTVTKDGALFFDDRVNMPNPPVGVYRANGSVQDNPLQALRDTLIDVLRSTTADFTMPHLMRGADGQFLGDTLAVRSTTADGWISSGPSTSYSTVQNGTLLSANTTTNPGVVFCTLSGSDYSIRAFYLDFDTSSLGSGATLSNGVFTLYGTGTAETVTDAQDIQIRPFDWGGTLTTADWVDFAPTTNWTNRTLMAHLNLGSWVQTNNTANNFTVDSYADVSKTGVTYVAVALARAGGSAPTGANQVDFYNANNAGTSSDPLLTVTYTVTHSGTIAATLQKAVFSGSGSQAQTGTIAAVLQKATAALSGAQTQIGTAAATMQKATFSGSGEQSYPATIAATIQAATFSGSGSQAGGTEGEIAATMQSPTASMTGAMQPSGTITANMQKATFSGAATQTQTGIVAATLQKATASLSGSQVYTGAMAAALQYALFSGAGAQVYTGSIAATMQPATAALVGVMQPSGVIAVTMQKATFSGAGTHQQIGAIAAALQAATFAGAGTQIQIGTIAGTLRYLTFEGIAVIAKPGFAIVLDSYANGMRLLDQCADGATLLDGYANGMTLFDLFADGITLGDGYSNGVEVRDGGE